MKEYNRELDEHTYSARPFGIEWEFKEKEERERLEQYFEMVLKYLPGGVAVVCCDSQGQLIPEFLSDGFLEMVDMTPEMAWEIYEENGMKGVHPEDQNYVKETLNNYFSKGIDTFELQYRIKKGNSSYLWVDAKCSVIKSGTNEKRLYINYRNITEEKERQEKQRLQYNEQIFQHYRMKGSDILILGHCNITQNRILEMVDNTNSGLLEKFGTIREEFFTGIGTLIPDRRERELFYSKYLNEPSSRAFQNGVTEVLMFCYIQLPKIKAGKYVQFQVNMVETPGTGDITGILTVTDITEKVIYDKIFSQLSAINYDLVADIDLFHNSYRIVSGGDIGIPETSGILDSRVEKILENVVSTEKNYVRNMLLPKHIMERLKEKDVYSFVYSIKAHNGTILTKNMHISAIDRKLGRICLIRSDVTDMLAEERRAKEKLKEALSEAETANRAKSDFLSSMSHDIRTPMNAIIGMTTLALNNIENQEKVREYLKKISISSQHLLSLINDILDMSQIEHEKIQLNESPIHLEEIINHLSSIMMPQAQNAGLHFKIESRNIEHSYFIGDMLRIKQIFINLLSNAFKFTLEGGNVWFKIRELNPHIKGNIRYCFTVQDTGIGMSEEFMENLFKPFVRSHKVSKVEGTGLGLSITKGLVELMNGTISVESRQKEGTAFRIELEFEQASEDKKKEKLIPAAEQKDKDHLKGRHFLVVEDNAINYEILGEFLQMWGATFTIKTDGLQAVEEFEHSKPGKYDAILMDIQMPVMNGYDAAHTIRRLSHPEAQSIIILAMTANAFAEDVQAASDAGMNGHIAKPLDCDLLYKTLSELLA